MSALDNLKAKDIEETTALEDCILQLAKSATWADNQTAKKGAEQLAAMCEAIEEARKALDEFSVAQPIGVSSVWLPSFEKARAARAKIEALK